MNIEPAKPLENAKCAMLVVLAALTVEQERWHLDETDSDNLAYLRGAQTVASKDTHGDDVSWEISVQEKAEWLADYRRRVGAHVANGVPRPVLARRIDRVMAAFSLFGYNPHYAGYEGHFRTRLCRLAGTGKFEQLDDESWNQPLIQTEAATYMAYTDYFEAELSRCRL